MAVALRHGANTGKSRGGDGATVPVGREQGLTLADVQSSVL